MGVGAALGFVALILARVTAGLVSCPDPDPAYTDYLVSKGYVVECALCLNTHWGSRMILAVLVLCVAMTGVGWIVARVAKRYPVIHALASMVLLTLVMGWVALAVGRYGVADFREWVLFFHIALVFAGAGAWLATRRAL